MHKTIFCRQSSVYSVDSASKTFNLAWFPVWKPFCETKQETLLGAMGISFFVNAVAIQPLTCTK